MRWKNFQKKEEKKTKQTLAYLFNGGYSDDKEKW